MIKKRYKTPMAKFHELKGARLLLSESEQANYNSFTGSGESGRRAGRMMYSEEDQW